MFSMAPGVISQQDGVQVVTHMEVHVREVVTRSQGDIALAKTPPLVSDSPACVTDVLLSSNERMFVLALDHPAKHWHCCEEAKMVRFTTAVSSLTQASLPSLLINEGKPG